MRKMQKPLNLVNPALHSRWKAPNLKCPTECPLHRRVEKNWLFGSSYLIVIVIFYCCISQEKDSDGGSSPTAPFRDNMEMKWVALVLLVVQNTALVLLMRSSLTSTADHYIVTTAVASMECVKVVTCLFIEAWFAGSAHGLLRNLQLEVMAKPYELLMLAVPSILYTLQNNLLYIALANLPSATYQVCYQLKILTTAVFSVVILQRSLTQVKWVSLFILTAGVSLTELDAAQVKANPGQDKTAQNPVLGFVCVVMASVTSGFAGVWFEKILKNAKTSMWMRNIQMGMTSIVIALIGVYSKDGAKVAEKGFFYGYNGAVIGVIMLQAMGGLVVAAVIKYADNILKGFASSMSIVISCLVEYFFFEFQPTLRFVLGATLVNYAVYLYSSGWSWPPQPRVKPGTPTNDGYTSGGFAPSATVITKFALSRGWLFRSRPSSGDSGSTSISPRAIV